MLELNGVDAWYGRSQVLRGVELRVAPGEIVALLGRNGAGRSTTVKAVMGLVQAAGSIRWHGRELSGCSPHEVARAGVGYVPEGREVFAGLSVAQNLLMGRWRRAGRFGLDDAYRLFPQLQARCDTDAAVLSGGEQQMLALCRTLMGDPALLLIDEPTEGLAPQAVAEVAAALRQLRSDGRALLLVEQKLTLAFELADRCLVMGSGRIVFDGSVAQLRAAAAVRREWLEV